MRLWSLHPSLLDRAGLVATWREALLAQAVLAGKTKGYRSHPQLERFRASENPLQMIGSYLSGLHEEATTRGYRFDATKILAQAPPSAPLTPVTTGQVAYEREHLLRKLRERSPTDAERLTGASASVHPIFEIVAGPLEAWERPL